MDISRLKKLFAGVSVAAISLTQVATAIAAYSDVPGGAWYETAVESFVDNGYLDATQTRFRGGDNANRAEFVKLVVALNGGIVNTAPALPSFNDVAVGAWYYAYFEEAGKEGWVRGDGSCYGTRPCFARPSANINRAEAAAIIVRAFNLDSTGAAPQFVDNPSGQWYTSDIQTAADHCVLQGDDSTGRVRPGDNMNRAEMVVMLYRVDQNLAYGSDCGSVTVGEPMVKNVVATSATTVEVDYNVDIDQTALTDKTKYTVTGGSALPIDSVKTLSKSSVELMLSAAMEAGKEYTLTVVDMKTVDSKTFSDSKTFMGYKEIVQGNGTLEVTLSAKNPLGDTIPKGAQGVVFASLDLTAASDDVVLEDLTVLHEGFGASSDFSGVYAMIDGARVSRKRSIDSQSYTSTLRFTKPITIAKGKTITLQIAGDLTTSAVTASEHNLAVELPSDFVSNAKSVKGNFPLKGKTFRVAAVSAGTLSIAYRSVTPSTAKVGDKAFTIGKFEVSIDSVEDQTLYSLTVQNDGTAGDGDFTNLQIRRSDGTVLTKTVASTSGDYATFVFDPPFTILEGERVTLNLVADIVGGASKNIKMHFDETGDIFSVGSLWGYGLNGQLYGSLIALPVETTTLPGTVSIDAGQFTISVDGPVTTQYTKKEKNALLANVWFEAGSENVDIEELYILIQGTTSTGAAFNQGRAAPTAADAVSEVLEKVQLRNTTTGRTISGVSVTGSARSTNGTGTGSYHIYRFDDFVVKGKEKYEFTVNFIDNSGAGALAAPANGDRFRIHICGEATHKLVSGTLTANTTGCSMGGFIATTVTSYQMKIKGVSTNDRVGDYRPGGTITGNVQEIKTASLTLTGKATSASETAVKNAKNVNLMRFEARSGEGGSNLITSLIFAKASSAGLINASNYALWVDTNDDGVTDTILQKGVASQSDQITFDKLTGGGYVVPKSKSVVFEVHADIAASFTTTSPVLSVRFDTGATFVQAEQVSDGTALSGIGAKNPGGSYITSSPFGTSPDGTALAEIQVTTAYATQYTLRNQGDLYVTLSSQPVKSKMLLGGSLADEILRLQFRGEYEDIDVTDLVFTASGANASSMKTDAARLELYKVGATAPFAIATPGGCGTTAVPTNSFCVQMKSQEFIVKKGQNENVLIRPRMNTDVDGAVSGNQWTIKMDLTPSASTGSIRARGAQSSNTLDQNDGDATAEGEVFIGRSTATATNALMTGKVNNVVLSKLTGLTNADASPNGTAIPVGTQKAIGQFKFTTAAAGSANTKNGTNKWTLSGVIFNVNATNVLLGTGDQTATATSDFKLYNKADPTVKNTCIANKATTSGSIVITCEAITVRSSVNTQIDPGADATFVLEAEVVNPKISNSSTSTLQVSIQSFSENPYETVFGASNTHLVWTDLENTGTVFKWLEFTETSVNGVSYSG